MQVEITSGTMQDGFKDFLEQALCSSQEPNRKINAQAMIMLHEAKSRGGM